MKRIVKQKYADVTGGTFHENLAIMYLFSDEYSHDYWLFKCPFCKGLYVARLDLVKAGHTMSCGCLNNVQWRKQMKEKPPKANVNHVQEIKKNFINSIIQFAAENNSSLKHAFDYILENYEFSEWDETQKLKKLEGIVQIYLKETYDGYSTLQKIIL